MLRKRGFIMLVASLVLGLGAAVVARGWIAEQAAKEKADRAIVIAAAMAIPFGTQVEERHLKIIEMPKDAVPPGSFSEIEAVVEKVATQQIVAGEILMQARFVEQGSGSTLAAMVDKKMRAVTVRVDDVIGVGGFLLPGNRVDVVAALASLIVLRLIPTLSSLRWATCLKITSTRRRNASRATC